MKRALYKNVPAGFGLAQLAENIVADHLQEETGGSADGLAAAPVPVTLLYPHQRFLSAVRAFAEWMSEVV